jgi:hypothetical protein
MEYWNVGIMEKPKTRNREKPLPRNHERKRNQMLLPLFFVFGGCDIIPSFHHSILPACQGK